MQQNSLKSASFEAIRLNRLIVVSDRKEVIIMKKRVVISILTISIKTIIAIALAMISFNAY